MRRRRPDPPSCPTCGGYLPTRLEQWGREVKQARKDLGMTQEELAQAVGCANETIRRTERGDNQPRDERLDRLIDYLGVSDPRRGE